MKPVIFKTLVLLSFFLTVTALKAEIHTTPGGHRVEITLIPDKKEILIDEPMYFSLYLGKPKRLGRPPFLKP